jgi:ribosomal protein L44E
LLSITTNEKEHRAPNNNKREANMKNSAFNKNSKTQRMSSRKSTTTKLNFIHLRCCSCHNKILMKAAKGQQVLVVIASYLLCH